MESALPISSYDVLLVGVFAVVLPAAFLATVHSEQAQVRQALETKKPAEGSADSTEDADKRRAVKLFQLGIASGSEVRLLCDHIAKLDFIVNQTTHVFLSYRVAADAPLATALCEQLSTRVLAATGQKVRVYLDVMRLEDGQRWDQGFMGGLAESMVFVPVVSVGALRPMMKLGAAGERAAESTLEKVGGVPLDRDDGRRRHRQAPRADV